MQDSYEKAAAAVRGSQVLRLLFLGFLVVVLQIPIAGLSELVRERSSRRDEAIDEVSSRWGNAQAITGPLLVLPFTHRATDTSLEGRPYVQIETRQAVFLPEELRIRATLGSEIRRRGIFSVPVYKLDLAVEGQFAPPNLAAVGIDPASVAWDGARLVVGIADARAIQAQSTLAWNGTPVQFQPGVGGLVEAGTGIHAAVPVGGGAASYTFAFPLVLNGSVGLQFVPLGQSTHVELDCNAGSPSFEGKWLPAEHLASVSGFTARWDIPALGRNFPQAWRSESGMQETIGEARFGVKLIDPVDHYRMAERSVKYAALFILLSFTAVWLLEVLSGSRVHAIQYLLLGVALCLFYLLELSLSEHLGFPLAYTLASVLVVGMVAAYSHVIFHRAGRAAVVGAGVAALYAYLYVLLTNEDYALVIGSLGLFVMLGTIMFVTRHIDWYAPGARTEGPPPAP